MTDVNLEPGGAPGWPALPPFHLRRPRPLVIDLEGGLLAGAGAALAADDPARLRLCRGALDLLRLQRRFRGPVRLLTALGAEWGGWIAGLLGPGVAVESCGRLGVDKARAAVGHYGPGGFDFLGGLDSVTAVGPHACRLWLPGYHEDLQARMRTGGVTLILLSPDDAVAVADLAARSGPADWTGSAAAAEIRAEPSYRRSG